MMFRNTYTAQQQQQAPLSNTAREPVARYNKQSYYRRAQTR